MTKDRMAHDRRPSIRHDRTTPDNFDAFIFVPGTYPEPGRPTRLRVLAGDNTLVCFDVSEELTTSESRTSETLKDGVLGSISLTTEEAEWLVETLTRALEWEKKREGGA